MCSWCSKFNCTVFSLHVHYSCIIFIERCVPIAASLYSTYSEVGDNVIASGWAPYRPSLFRFLTHLFTYISSSLRMNRGAPSCVCSVSACFWQLICSRFFFPWFREAAAKGDHVLLASRLCWPLAETNGQACAYSYCWSCLIVRQHSLAVRCKHMGVAVCLVSNISSTCVQPISSVYHMACLKTWKNGQKGLQNPWLW
jgi:hypothetical protein